jgi:LPS sulfotransferase NodH
MTMGSNRDPQSQRPDLVDLIGPEFDGQSSAHGDRTLIICSAPRTGSYELCRYLLAAGIGVPHEYFHIKYARLLGERWAIADDPLREPQLGRYIDQLRRRRAQNGVFATKLQYDQFEQALRNRHGAALFDGACVVHLFRPDVAAQYASYRAAITRGVWDFSQRQTSEPVIRDPANFDKFFADALTELRWIVDADAGFRGLFILLGIRPLFVTTDELFGEPHRVIRRIADATGAAADDEALQRAVACSAAYGRDHEGESAFSGLAERFRKIAFPEPR